MLKKELADALGISAPMVSKLAKRGMPTDTVERAQRWRKRHLEPGRLKSNRAKGQSPAPPSGAGGPVEVRPAPRPPTPASPDDEGELSGQPDGELVFQKIRETKARADKLELELAELKGALTRADQTRMGVYAAARLLRDDLMHVGRNAALKVLQASTLHDKQAVIEQEIRDALNSHVKNLAHPPNKASGPTPAPPSGAGEPVEVRPPTRPPTQASPGDGDEFTGPLDGELVFQKIRETKARADKLELELGELQGALIRVDQTGMDVFTCARSVRDALMCVGRNAAHKVLQSTTLHDSQAVIDREIGAVLDFQDKRMIPDLIKKIAPKLPPDGDTGTT